MIRKSNSINNNAFLSIHSRQKIVDTMTEQRQQLELLYTNDIVDEQNRILRQINDFTLVLFNLLYRYIDTQVISSIE